MSQNDEADDFRYYHKKIKDVMVQFISVGNFSDCAMFIQFSRRY